MLLPFNWLALSKLKYFLVILLTRGNKHGITANHVSSYTNNSQLPGYAFCFNCRKSLKNSHYMHVKINGHKTNTDNMILVKCNVVMQCNT